MIKKLRLFFVAMLLGVFLTSCGPSTIQIPPDGEIPPDVQDKINQCILKETPKWYTVYPDGKDEEGKVVKTYHSGQTIRDMLEHAKRFAVYEAQKNLAESIGARLNLRTKEFLAYDGSDLIANDLDEVVKRIVAEQSAGGYSILETHFATCESAKIVGWALLEYDLGNENKILVEEINSEPDLAIELRRSEAFQELEEELNKAN